VGDDLQKFFASGATAAIGLSALGPQDFGKSLQDCVSQFVPETVVDTLEVIEIHRHDPERKACRATQKARRPRWDCPAVQQAGQRIGEARFLQLAILGLDLALQLDQPLANSYAGKQFIGVKTAGEVIVRTGRKPF
jgi:hypothetical protein